MLTSSFNNIILSPHSLPTITELRRHDKMHMKGPSHGEEWPYSRECGIIMKKSKKDIMPVITRQDR